MVAAVQDGLQVTRLLPQRRSHTNAHAHTNAHTHTHTDACTRTRTCTCARMAGHDDTCGYTHSFLSLTCMLQHVHCASLLLTHILHEHSLLSTVHQLVSSPSPSFPLDSRVSLTRVCARWQFNAFCPTRVVASWVDGSAIIWTLYWH